ncbi:aminotransferase class I/II-fold pyridoxal phosphate-dependent enzyme [Kitasatospora purpeofusca]|nr:pyridoxal-dependent decarboxylase [Kitasatospora purpeofusca]MCX4756797.1 aminotransferase class I/II-fold pyridoxal phosphate-dependent enzyme [Kitasatospora purpeofusca]WSR35421.1 aminotransferase class I/II-fold pyridoxal phosphate-dependent enzyme [Kitasatospora purpeofusca]
MSGGRGAGAGAGTGAGAEAGSGAGEGADAPLDALSGGVGGPAALGPLLATVLDALETGATRRGGPLPPGRPADLAALVDRALAAAEGPDALARLTELLAHGAADPADPFCAAHLHCPPLAVAAAADLAVSALNPSQDSWDQAPAATALETALLAELAALVGYDPARAAGVVTSGGTESNLMGLMLARDQKLDGIVELDGLLGLPAGVRPRIFASRAAHFSVQRAAALLGLGERAVVPIDVDRDLRMDPVALERALAEASWAGHTPVAVVATAGTTDTGAVDPLPAAAELAARYDAWLHVDAAYGGGALLSDRLAPLLDGIERADSVSLDWHKLGWQPAAAGVFLVRHAENYVSLARRAVYLNPADDEQAGYPSLLGLSLRTTRRADAFKLAVTLRTLGRAGLGRLVDACHDLARSAADTVRDEPELELHAEPVLTALLFRYRPAGLDSSRSDVDPAALDRVNAELRRELLRGGRAVVGRTELPGEGPGRVRLKLTLLNPHTTPAEVAALIGEVVRAGRRTWRWVGR